MSRISKLVPQEVNVFDEIGFEEPGGARMLIMLG